MFREEIKVKPIDESISIDSFLDAAQIYNSIDDALSNLPGKYLQFYLDNERVLNKSLHSIFEGTESGYLGWGTPEQNVIKKIKYKGEILILEYDNKSHLWDSYVGYRSIVKALKQGKDIIDNKG